MAATISGQQFFEWPGGPALPPWSKFTLQCDNSYPTGGYVLDKAAMGYPGSREVFITSGLARIGAAFYRGMWDDDNLKMLILVEATGAEAAPGADLSALVMKCVVIGVQ